jgi:hypothetical protein
MIISGNLSCANFKCGQNNNLKWSFLLFCWINILFTILIKKYLFYLIKKITENKQWFGPSNKELDPLKHVVSDSIPDFMIEDSVPLCRCFFFALILKNEVIIKFMKILKFDTLCILPFNIEAASMVGECLISLTGASFK